MNDRRGRVIAILDYLGSAAWRNETEAEEVMYAPCGYGIPAGFPETADGWEPFGRDSTWGGRDQHFLFHSSVSPEKGHPLAITLSTGATDIWNTL